MAGEDIMSFCLICKHELVMKINIFEKRTSISKTLLSSKLSKIVLDPFNQKDMDLDCQNVCASCWELLNHVDECECKLMALQNEVKLKYKMPFAIDVRSRVREEPAPQLPAETPPAELPVVGCEQEFESAPQPEQPAVISIQADSGLGPTYQIIPVTQANADGTITFYRESPQAPAGPADSMPGLDALMEAQDQPDDGGWSDAGAPDDNAELYFQPSSKQQLKRDAKSQRKHGALKLRLSQAERDSLRKGMKDAVKCRLCEEIYPSTKALISHMATHVNKNNKEKQCGFCPLIFTNHMLLHKHWNRKHPEQLKPCPFCEQRFATNTHLRRHMKIHKDPEFQCEKCGRHFYSKADLRKHCLIKHSDVKNFQCPDCPQKFKLNWMLVRHRVRMHGREYANNQMLR